MRQDLVIVTATYFTPEESAYDLSVAVPLTVRMLKLAELRGLAAIVVDGSPDDEVRRTLERAGAEVLRQETPGFGPAVRQAVAAGAKVIRPDGSIHWQEPMKDDLVQFQSDLANFAAREDLAVLIPGREESTWDTYPREQVLQEQLTNLYVETISGGRLRYDFTFGPKIFRRHGIKLVARYNGGVWDAHMVPVVHAVKMGMRVGSHTVPYSHPVAQRQAEEGQPEWIRKRLKQLNHVTSTLEAAWNAA